MAIPQPDPVTLECVYDEEVFLSPPPEELQCVICLRVARDPHMIMEQQYVKYVLIIATKHTCIHKYIVYVVNYSKGIKK